MARYFRKGAEAYRIEGSVVEVVIFLCILMILSERKIYMPCLKLLGREAFPSEIMSIPQYN